MESDNHDQSSVYNPSSNKRRKLDTADLPPPIENNNANCPIMKVAIDILSKIIAFVPIAQWHALELVDPNFREATLLAWRSLRSVNFDDFLFTAKQEPGESTLQRDVRSVESILTKLNNRSPYLTRLRGVLLQTQIRDLNLLILPRLARFEHLESISLDGSHLFVDHCYDERPLQHLVLFLEMARSRETLKHISIDRCSVDDLGEEGQRTTSIFGRRLAELLSDDHGTKEALKLETFAVSKSKCARLSFDLMDTSRLTVLDFGESLIKSDQLTSLIRRATNLERLRFSFFHCNDGEEDNCGGHGLRHNKHLLKTISSREKLKALEFNSNSYFSYGWDHHGNCMRFEEFFDMLKTLGRRGALDELTIASDNSPEFFSPTFDWSRLIATISEHMPRLRSLNIPVNDCIASDLIKIVEMEHLEEISFGYECEYKKSHQMTEGFFPQLAMHKRLKRLGLHALSREDESRLIEMSNVSTLTDIQIRRMDSVRKEDFLAWSEGDVSNLESLILSGIGISDKDAELGLIALIKKATRLHTLKVEGRITDRFLQAIADLCSSKLDCLCVTSRRDDISIEPLQMIVDRCPGMKLGGLPTYVWDYLKFSRYRKATNVECPWNPEEGEDDDEEDDDAD